jgi:hypothetical protein
MTCAVTNHIIWHEFVKPCHGVIDTSCAIDEVEHEVEDDFRMRPGQHRPERSERNPPPLGIDQKKYKSSFRYVGENRGKHGEEVRRISRFCARSRTGRFTACATPRATSVESRFSATAKSKP